MPCRQWLPKVGAFSFTRDGQNFKAYIDGKQIGSLAVEENLLDMATEHKDFILG
jgi:hypothetical protein